MKCGNVTHTQVLVRSQPFLTALKRPKIGFALSLQETRSPRAEHDIDAAMNLNKLAGIFQAEKGQLGT